MRETRGRARFQVTPYVKLAEHWGIKLLSTGFLTLIFYSRGRHYLVYYVFIYLSSGFNAGARHKRVR